MGLLSQGIEDSRNGQAAGTQSKQTECFSRWKRFLAAIGSEDLFLDNWDTEQRIYLLCAFAASVRRNKFGTRAKKQLAGGTVSSTVSNICSSFRSNFRDDPSLDSSGKKALLLARQLKKYIAEDPAILHQMALPIVVFMKIWRAQMTKKFTVLAQMVIGAFFFGLRSCEYSAVTGTRLTKLLSVREIRFFQQRREVMKIAHNNNVLKYCTSVSITFINQKNGKKYITITQQASGHEICPVTAWAAIVSRILFEENGSLDTTVNSYKDENGVKTGMKASDIAKHLKIFVTQIGKHILGFDKSRVGTHSIRTSFAMLLYP